MVWHPTGAWDWKVVVMAHLENYKVSQVNAMLNHYGREEDDGVKRSNENIRPDATASNYVVLAGSHEPRHNTRTCAIGTRIRLRKQIDASNKVRAAKGKRKMDSRATVMCDFGVTLPKDWPKERDPYEFFKLCHEFLRKRYGDECSLPGFVHMDETTPHMHCPIVPMVDGEICKRDLVTRTELKRLHSDLQSYLDGELGFHVSVLLDESQKAEKAKSKLTQDELDALNKEIKADVDKQVASERAEIRSKASELDKREEDLKRDREAFKKTSDKREHEQNERDREQDDRDDQQDDRDRALNRRAHAVIKGEADNRKRADALDKQEASVKQDLGLLATLKNEVLALLKELRDALAEQRELSQARLDEIEERLDEVEQKVSTTNVSVKYDESYASWFEDTSHDADEYDIG